MRHDSIKLPGLDLNKVFFYQKHYFSSDIRLELISSNLQSFPDESCIIIDTWSFKTDEVDLEQLGRAIIHAVTLDSDICKAFQENNHITLYNDLETLTIHYNDSTITVIYHNNGEL